MLQAGYTLKCVKPQIDKVELNLFYLYKSLKRKVVKFLSTCLPLEKIA